MHTGGRLVLVDTGTAQCFGSGLGQVLGNLRQAGYAPEAVDAVLLGVAVKTFRRNELVMLIS